jgi:tropomyosin
MELQAESHQRKAKSLEAENANLERQLEEKSAQYDAVKAELEQTLKDLEGL